MKKLDDISVTYLSHSDLQFICGAGDDLSNHLPGSNNNGIDLEDIKRRVSISDRAFTGDGAIKITTSG